MERAVSIALGGDTALQPRPRDRIPPRARDLHIGTPPAAGAGGWRPYRADADDVHGCARRAARAAAGHAAGESAAARGAAAALCLAAHAELARAAAAPAAPGAHIAGRARARRTAMMG